MNNEEQFSTESSLALIRNMIDTARNRISNDGLSWLIWGTMIFLASLSTYFLIEFNADSVYLGWNVFGIAAVLILAYRLIKPRKKTVRTYVDDLLRLFNIGFAGCLLIIILSINISVSEDVGFGYFLMIYAFLMLIQGGALQFKPLMFGAAINALGSIAIFTVHVFKYDMLITAASVLIGYIIPGLILYIRHRRQKLNHGV